MIHRVSIRNFQSLRRVDLELGKFTVIVGDSNSGKSSFVRALKAVVSNTRGHQFVTRGQSKSTITLEKDNSKITLEKGEGIGCYLIAGDSEQIFTKIGTTVPPEITAALRVLPVDEYSVNFAGQHDTPYLLKDSGAAVARVLGDLTNVSVMFEAVREGNRRRNYNSATSKVLSQNLNNLAEIIKTFKDLSKRKTAIVETEQWLAKARYLQGKITDLNKMAASVSALQDLEKSLSESELPDAGLVRSKYDTLSTFKILLRQLNQANLNFLSVSNDLIRQDELICNLQLDLHSILVESGECPTCHQDIMKSYGEK